MSTRRVTRRTGASPDELPLAPVRGRKTRAPARARAAPTTTRRRASPSPLDDDVSDMEEEVLKRTELALLKRVETTPEYANMREEVRAAVKEEMADFVRKLDRLMQDQAEVNQSLRNAVTKAVLIPNDQLPSISSDLSALASGPSEEVDSSIPFVKNSRKPVRTQDSVTDTAPIPLTRKRKVIAMARSGFGSLASSVKGLLMKAVKESLILAASATAGGVVGGALGPLTGYLGVTAGAAAGAAVGAYLGSRPAYSLVNWTMSAIHYMCIDPIASVPWGTYAGFIPIPQFDLYRLGRFGTCGFGAFVLVGSLIEWNLTTLTKMGIQAGDSFFNEVIAPYVVSAFKWFLEKTGLGKYAEDLTFIRSCVEQIMEILKGNLEKAANMASAVKDFGGRAINNSLKLVSDAADYATPLIGKLYVKGLQMLQATNDRLIDAGTEQILLDAEAADLEQSALAAGELLDM